MNLVDLKTQDSSVCYMYILLHCIIMIPVCLWYTVYGMSPDATSCTLEGTREGTYMYNLFIF